MDKHQQIIKHIETIVQWENEDKFLIDVLMLSSSKLFMKCYSDLKDNSIVTIAPLLRNIHENIIVIFGLIGNVYSIKDFIKYKPDPMKIMNAIKNNKTEISNEQFNLVNNYFFELKKVLSNFSHTNFISVMSLFTERFQVDESITFNRILISYLITVLEAPFISMFNSIYETEIKIPEIINLNKELKEVKSLKYITRYFPESIKEFIDGSEILRGYYSNVLSELKKEVNEIKKFKS